MRFFLKRPLHCLGDNYMGLNLMDIHGGIRLNIITHIIAQSKRLKNALDRLERRAMYIEQGELNFAGAELCG